MLDLKVMQSVFSELEEKRNIPREKVVEAIEVALATAYKKEYGKRGQVIRAACDMHTGTTEFYQVKFVVDESRVRMPDEEDDQAEADGVFPQTQDGELDVRARYDSEKHILLEDAKRIKKDAQVDDELVFPLEAREDFGRIAAQTAKQVIIQKIREAEKVSILREYEHREGEIVAGTVERLERGNLFLNLGRALALLPREEQIPGERFRQGERVRSYLFAVEDSPRGAFLKVSRTHPKFLEKLFAQEAPELVSGAITIKAIAREPGSRSKVAVHAVDEHVDPVGALVGGRGVRVSTVMSELGGEKIDIIEWSADPSQFVEDALSPAKVVAVEIDEDEHRARVEVSEDQLSLAIGRAGQNVRLAAKLTGWRIDISAYGGEGVASAEGDSVAITRDSDTKEQETAGNQQLTNDEEQPTGSVEREAHADDTRHDAQTNEAPLAEHASESEKKKDDTEEK